MPLHIGAAWYPEHWPEERWPEDVKLMHDAGLTVVRVGEFAWADLEPREGAFNLGWLQRAVGLAADAGLAVVVGTPSAAPPAWLTQTYPDTLAVGEDGRPTTHGTRAHYDVTSERYTQLCRRVAEKLAVLFGNDSRVIGWQIDNEYNTVSYSDAAREQFQRWLLHRYGSLDKLNDAWLTSYWSQKYSDWSQIPLPIKVRHGEGNNHNPGLRLKWKQFVTEAYRRFQYAQIEVIRANAMPSQWVMHNHIGYTDAYDTYAVSEDLDLVAWNQYFPFRHLDFNLDNFGHDQVRGLKRKHFWITETQPGSINWAPINEHLHKGEVRAVAWSAVAHGADAVCYWQWRNALNGQEQYHGSLLGTDGNPRPVFDEIQRISADFRNVAGLLDAPVSADAAVLFSFDDRWTIDFQRHNANFDPMAHLLGYYSALSKEHVALDVLSTRATFSDSGYKLIVAAPHVIDERIAAQLIRFVESGGQLVLGARSGVKTVDNALWPQRQPALLQDLVGTHVEEYFAMRDPFPLSLEGEGWGEGERRSTKRAMHTGHTWAEWLVPDKGTEVLARYGKCNGWLDGQAAITMKQHGSGGRVYLVGAWLDEALMAALMGRVIADADVRPVLSNLPASVHAMKRGDAYILINGATPVTVTLPTRMTNVLTGKAAKTLTLGVWDVAVVR